MLKCLDIEGKSIYLRQGYGKWDLQAASVSPHAVCPSHFFH